jgi:OmpA-OmpF porin, OOP family
MNPIDALLRQGLRCLLALGLLSGAGALCAQDSKDNKVLSGSQVTESALIDALALEEPTATGATRGFRPATAGGAAPKPAGPGKANLLITFNTGSTEVTPESRRILDTLAKAMQSDTLAGLSFRVEGHADARGDVEMNLRLSQQRAEAVARYLVEQHGILAERLAPKGKGSAEPLNRERVDAPENRRVTIVSQRG